MWQRIAWAAVAVVILFLLIAPLLSYCFDWNDKRESDAPGVMRYAPPQQSTTLIPAESALQVEQARVNVRP